MVDGSTAGIISEDSSNVVELVKAQYEDITTTIAVKTNSTKNCKTKITSKCEGNGPKCSNIELGTPVEFELKVKLKVRKNQINRNQIDFLKCLFFPPRNARSKFSLLLRWASRTRC